MLSLGVFGFSGSPRSEAYLLSGQIDVLLDEGSQLAGLPDQLVEIRILGKVLRLEVVGPDHQEVVLGPLGVLLLDDHAASQGVVVVDVGLHKRLATWLLGWTKGFLIPTLVLCLSMSMLGSFVSAHAMCAFMTPVMAAVYFGAVSAKSSGGKIEHDPALAKFLLFTLCFALNVGGIGSPAAGGRNVIMMGF